MTEADTKKVIKSALQSFRDGDLSQKSLKLYQTLGYITARENPFSEKTYRFFKESFLDGDTRFSKEKALVSEWKYVDLLFQLSKDEITPQHGLFDTKQVDRTIIETYLFFVIELSQDHYSRTALSQITRELNKVFPMPVMVLFKYGQSLTLAVINRRLHKRDEQKDVLEKVTLIKDISIENPHRAHIEILFDLSFAELLRVNKFSNFVELHNAWQKTLDTKELNKRFYQELANWYFWAMEHVSFPEDVEKNKDIRNATSLIRLITRIIFIWFIKEKDLVPEALFDRKELSRILKEFDKNNQSHSYYHAILQNLFFGTLNQKMDERGFAQDEGYPRNKTEYGVKNLFRYANHFAISEKEALALFKDIPFLNGGLFDCLDKENEEGKVLYTDGFSRNPKKQAIVSDFLFFGAEEEYDLNEIYGTKNKRYKVKGLIEILSSYKFTVTENTPIEEEVALDPELLGKVFENLLASYNPETQTTARKQTGSFYTPREIVNYMVDESLKAYLKQALVDKLNIKAEDAETGLEILFSYTEREHAFTHDETKALIRAIDTCKILDPACGSGAFPMGILHKLVHILYKLDPKNEQWKERQIQKAHHIDDPAIRDHLIADIESAFENNELDYGRKLYLIENCIYGVDIQPIAGQIAKLRFFISLVVDQNKQPGKENLGIRSLPNLETKFVAANTLIGLEKPKAQRNLFENKEIIALEEKLKELRHRYFSAKTRKEKMACQKEDKTLRQKIAKLLVNDGWAQESARQIVAFDPYDQNDSSPFFDQEWMFGIKGGFDVVIGNPPYVSYGLRNALKMSTEDKEFLRNRFPNSAEYKISLYALFIDMSIRLSKNGGIQSLIVPDSFLLGMYFSKIRKLILSSNDILEILWIPDGVFDTTIGYSVIYFFQRSSFVNSKRLVRIKAALSSEQVAQRNFNEFSYAQEYFNRTALNRFRLFFNSKDKYLVEKIESKAKNLLGEIVKITTGVRSKSGKDAVIAKAKKSNSWKKGIISSAQVLPYFVTWDNDWINIDNKLLFSGGWDARFVERPKVMIRQTGDSIIAGIDYEDLYHLNNVHTCAPLQDNLDVRFVAAILNSKLMNMYYHLISLEEGRTMAQTDIETLEKLPIASSYPDQQKRMIKLVDKILAVKAKSPEADVSEMKREIDELVYQLYGLTEEEINIVEIKV